MKKDEIIEMKFIGTSKFPIDMLRYDSCYPATESDSYTILRTINWEERGAKIEKTLITVKKRKINQSPWNLARWKSFGWEPVYE